MALVNFRYLCIWIRWNDRHHAPDREYLKKKLVQIVIFMEKLFHLIWIWNQWNALPIACSYFPFHNSVLFLVKYSIIDGNFCFQSIEAEKQRQNTVPVNNAEYNNVD